MREDIQALGLLAPDHEPCATHYMTDMIHMIQQLIDKQYAYVSEEGDVCFEVAKFPTYGQLAQQDLDGLLAGPRRSSRF